MIAIKNLKMPVDCQSCFARFGCWCRLDLDERMVVPALPEESANGFKPEWCPLVEVPDIHVGNSSEIPNSSETISRKGCRQEVIGNAGYF